jgi:hypothetical protein
VLHCIALQEIGVGDTCAWKIAGLDPLTTFGVYLEVVNQHTQPIAHQFGLVQFITQFQACNGQRRVRVSTVARKCVVLLWCGEKWLAGPCVRCIHGRLI